MTPSGYALNLTWDHHLYLIALLFSATFQKRVERLAREVMSDPVRISIGNVGQVIWEYNYT